MSPSPERAEVRAARIAWLAILIALLAIAIALAYWVGALGHRVVLQYVTSVAPGSPPPFP